MNLLLARTRIVLIRPSLPENVGAVARAMRHFGLRELVLVEGVSATHPLAVAVASGAEEILARARRVDSLEMALAEAVLVLGTTARPQAGVERRSILPRQGALLARGHGPAGPVALVFGTEKHGMSNDELRRCHQLITIPGTHDACLNLGAAMTLCAYEFYLASLPPVEPDVPMTAVAAESGLKDLADSLAQTLARAGLLKARDLESKRHALGRILSRARLEPHEAAMLRGLIEAALRSPTAVWPQTEESPSTPSSGDSE